MDKSFEQIRQTALCQRKKKYQLQITYFKEHYSHLSLGYERALEISCCSISQLVHLLNNNKTSSIQIVASLILRCEKIIEQYNCFSFTNFIEALKKAQECDCIRKQSGKKNWVPSQKCNDQQKFLPPLFGIPISIKDCFDMKGFPTTLGVISRVNQYKNDCEIIRWMKDSGLIPFIKTNVPQFCMTFETTNNLWGTTLNPWDKTKSPGGSSGGEGAIISSRCSFLGIGSDIGGSIRIPSSFCGIYGLRPSGRRISNQSFTYGTKSLNSLEKIIPNSIGPLGRSSMDLALFMDMATNQKYQRCSHDPYTKIIPFDWREFFEAEKAEKKLKIGIIKSLRDVQASKASIRAINQLAHLLTQNGHLVQQVEIPNQQAIIRWFNQQFLSYRGINYKQILKGEKHSSPYNGFFNLVQMDNQQFQALSKEMKQKQPRSYRYFFSKHILSNVNDYQNHLGDLYSYRRQWIKYWRDNKLDYILCPTFATQAFQHQKSQHLILAAAYTYIWNCLDATAGVIPVTVVKENELQYESKFDDGLTKQLKEINKETRGLPVGVQIVSLPFQQEKVLGFMSYLEKNINFYQKHPLPDV